MGSEWPAIRLSEVYEFSSGLSKPRSAFGTGFPFLSFKDVFYNYFVPDHLEELVESTEIERERCSVIAGDVFLTRTSETQNELGMSCVARRSIPHATFNGFTKRLRPKPGSGLDPTYAGYYFRSPRFRRLVTAMSSLSTRASLNNEMLARLEITIPPLDEQRRIAAVLGSLDDKIELNRQMGGVLDETTQAIFRSMLDAWATAPVDSLAGLFPNARQVVITGPFGSSLHASDYRDTGTPLVLVKHVNGGHIADNGLPLVGEHKSGEMQRYRLQPGDIVFTRVGAVGRSAYVHPHQVGWLISGQMLRVRLPRNTVLHPRFLAQTFTQPGFIRMVEGHAVGSTRPSLNIKVLSDLQFPVPSWETQMRFAEAVSPIDARFVLCQQQSSTLSAARDTLLPRLLSGELRVADVEKAVEEVV